MLQFGTSDRYWLDALDFALDSGFAPQILSCVPVCHLGSILVQHLVFCLVFGFGASYSVSCSGLAPQILSWVLVWCLRSILVRRVGFCFVLRFDTLDQY